MGWGESTVYGTGIPFLIFLSFPKALWSWEGGGDLFLFLMTVVLIFICRFVPFKIYICHSYLTIFHMCLAKYLLILFSLWTGFCSVVFNTVKHMKNVALKNVAINFLQMIFKFYICPTEFRVLTWLLQRTLVASHGRERLYC